MIRCAAVIVAMVLVAAVAGCDHIKAWSQSPEDRINEAFPLSAEVRTSRLALADIELDTVRQDIEAQLESRLKLRALSCAKGFAPTWRSSMDDIRAKLDSACFIEADADIARWLGYFRVAELLARPPLRPIPSSAPAYIVFDEYVQFARFAENAAVAIIQKTNAIEILDLASNKTMYRGDKGARGSFGFLSANGRLFTVTDGASLKIREVESGSVLVELPSVTPQNFHWLDERVSIYNKGGRKEAVVVDWSSGREATVSALNGHLQKAVAVPGSQDQYLLFTKQGVTKIGLIRDRVELDVELIAEEVIPSARWQSGGSDVTVDGSYVFSTAKDLTIVSTATLEFETIEMDPLRLAGGIPGPKPDELIFFAQSPSIPGGRYAPFIYSIGGRTLQAVNAPGLGGRRVLYIAPFRKFGWNSGSKIEVFQELPVLEEVSLSAFRSDQLNIANQRILEAFDREQAAESGTTGTSATSNGAPLGELARDAQITAVGVYQPPRNSDGRGPGVVQVYVRRSARPIVLVVSAYESAVWSIRREPGAKLAAVLVSSYEESKVYGAGDVQVVVMGRAFAYKPSGRRYNELNRVVKQYTGKPIGLFQGKYEAGAFRVGGG